MFPTPCIGKTSKKFGKWSFILGRILPPPAWLKCVDICFCTAAAKKNGFWQCECMLVSYPLLEPWVLAVYPQASISGATVNTGKQHPMGTEILTNDELPWVSRCLGTGTRSFLQSMPTGQSPRTQQLQSMGHAVLLLPPPPPHSSSTCSPREKQSPSFPWDLGKDLCTLRRWVPQLQSFIFPACMILQHRDHWWEVRANMWLTVTQHGARS